MWRAGAASGSEPINGGPVGEAPGRRRPRAGRRGPRAGRILGGPAVHRRLSLPRLKRGRDFSLQCLLLISVAKYIVIARDSAS